MTFVILAVIGIGVLLVFAWFIRGQSRRRAAKAEAQVAEDKLTASRLAKVASESEVSEAGKDDERKPYAQKQARHLSRDCDCGLYKQLWGFVAGGPIQWDVVMDETGILGITVSFDEVARMFGENLDNLLFEQLQEMLCAADAPHYWKAMEEQVRTYDALDDASGILIRRPAYLSRTSRKPKSQVATK